MKLELSPTDLIPTIKELPLLINLYLRLKAKIPTTIPGITKMVKSGKHLYVALSIQNLRIQKLQLSKAVQSHGNEKKLIIHIVVHYISFNKKNS